MVFSPEDNALIHTNLKEEQTITTSNKAIVFLCEVLCIKVISINNEAKIIHLYAY